MCRRGRAFEKPYGYSPPVQVSRALQTFPCAVCLDHRMTGQHGRTVASAQGRLVPADLGVQVLSAALLVRRVSRLRVSQALLGTASFYQSSPPCSPARARKLRLKHHSAGLLCADGSPAPIVFPAPCAVHSSIIFRTSSSSQGNRLPPRRRPAPCPQRRCQCTVVVGPAARHPSASGDYNPNV